MKLKRKKNKDEIKKKKKWIKESTCFVVYMNSKAGAMHPKCFSMFS
jgi:hypothetical protein